MFSMNLDKELRIFNLGTEKDEEKTIEIRKDEDGELHVPGCGFMAESGAAVLEAVCLLVDNIDFKYTTHLKVMYDDAVVAIATRADYSDKIITVSNKNGEVKEFDLDFASFSELLETKARMKEFLAF